MSKQPNIKVKDKLQKRAVATDVKIPGKRKILRIEESECSSTSGTWSIGGCIPQTGRVASVDSEINITNICSDSAQPQE